MMGTADTIVKRSSIAGKGVYAARDFSKGETVLIWHPERVLSKRQLASLTRSQRSRVEYAGAGKYHLMGSPERYVNHSCEANTYPFNGKDVAMRDIRKGEEITSDYSLNAEENMECTCGSMHCRRVIVPFDKLDTRTKRRLAKYLQLR